MISLEAYLKKVGCLEVMTLPTVAIVIPLFWSNQFHIQDPKR